MQHETTFETFLWTETKVISSPVFGSECVCTNLDEAFQYRQRVINSVRETMHGLPPPRGVPPDTWMEEMGKLPGRSLSGE